MAGNPVDWGGGGGERGGEEKIKCNKQSNVAERARVADGASEGVVMC